MHKEEFLAQLRCGLSGLPQDDAEERLTFYSEMIDDRMEEGCSEEEAVRGMGPVEELVSHSIEETPLTKLVKERIAPKKKLSAWEIVCLVLGAPVWLSLLVAVLGVVVALYVSLWAVLISLWAVFASVVGGALGAVVAGGLFALRGNGLTGTAMLGAGIACAGLAILAFFGCKVATKGTLWLTKKMAFWIKTCFVKKEGVA